ncbi:hypothetical protein TNCV_3217341 [Trichonephila clavipes]|nr:hypothetical protein TNCV_3217341 [Trichonephila clavipes]
MTKVRLELLTDIDMPLFIEKGIRGGVEMIGHRYAKANNVCRKKQFNSPPQLENQSQCRIKTTQLVSRNETTQLGSRNETTQLASRNETTQLASRNETTQLCTAVDRLQPPASPAPPLQQNRLFLPTNTHELTLGLFYSGHHTGLPDGSRSYVKCRHATGSLFSCPSIVGALLKIDNDCSIDILYLDRAMDVATAVIHAVALRSILGPPCKLKF